jgi:hypothetical protein
MSVTNANAKMRSRLPILFLSSVLLLAFPVHVHAQAWSNILSPVPLGKGTGKCMGCAIDWSTAGIPGGIPDSSWTQSGSTIAASQSPCNSGAGDCTSTIQTALNACGTNHYILLGSGTFLVNGVLTLPSNCALRGAGANLTILNSVATSNVVVMLGGDNYKGFPTAGTAITAGNMAGSTSITLSSAAGISVGNFLVIDQINDGTFVDNSGTEGACTWCDGGQTSDGSRVQGQLALVTSVSGNVVGISPALTVSYTNTPTIVPFAATAEYSGVENLQIYSNGTSGTSNIEIGDCAYCWVTGVESNYTAGDHIDVDFSYHCEITNNYFTGTYGTGPGAYDHGIRIANKSTGILIQNNIFERTGVIESEWGDAGNVISYNFKTLGYSTTDPTYLPADIEAHGAHPQFDLFEGNVVSKVQMDSIHGSVSNATFFRNWITGAGMGCNPLTGTRGTVVCTPTGVQGASGINGWWDSESVIGGSIDFLSTYMNFVGDIVGSANMNALTVQNAGTTLMGQSDLINYTSTRSYSTVAYGFTFGFGNTADTGSGGLTADAGCSTAGLSYPCHSGTPYATSLIHGVYFNFDGTTTWASGVTHTLPASFYLSAQPSWWATPWGTPPWPPIGPDVTGGIDAGGHANMIPAQLCYVNTPRESDNTLAFNPNQCYGAQGNAPAPPTNLTVVLD